MKGYLFLCDGTKLYGNILGDPKNAIGEVVFNTGMTGYQEIVTDPSYFGQIVVLTYPMIGNYGVLDQRNQSKKVQVKGLVVRECNPSDSNWSSEGSFEDYLLKHNLVAIEGIDTRYLTKLIRTKGTMTGQIVCDESHDLNEIESYTNNKPSYEVSTKEIYTIGEGDINIAVYDFGIKNGILSQLVNNNFRLTVYPAATLAEDILKTNPDGIFLSNGPGDPEELNEIVSEIKVLAEQKPIFGICLGHQLLSLAFGAKTEKLKFGHRGSNHPVKDINKNRVFITSQNHGYVVCDDSLRGLDLEITHYNVNDNSVEGFKHKKKPIFSVQYHPEASPGPDDSNYLFDEFRTLILESGKETMEVEYV